MVFQPNSVISDLLGGIEAAICYDPSSRLEPSLINVSSYPQFTIKVSAHCNVMYLHKHVSVCP